MSDYKKIAKKIKASIIKRYDFNGRQKLFVSVSGGETSWYMAQWLNENMQELFEMVFVFANTGQEDEETLIFNKKCEEYFGIDLVWLEAKVYHGKRKGSGYNIVSYETASRNGEPFEEVIKKYGIPNQSFPHCTRETKTNPMHSYIKQHLAWKDYYTAIGIREDESGRVNKKADELKLIYPLISKQMRPMTKPKINFWWSQQPFRLNLKGYHGNCMTCWKKADVKLFTIAKEDVSKFSFPIQMESKYGNYIPESRLKLMRERGEKPSLPVTFFRKNRSSLDIIEESKHFTGSVNDDSKLYDLVGGESCEIYSECGS